MTTTAPVEASSTPNPTPASQETIERVFEYAWHRTNAFDERSGQLKKRYRRIRESIILITWMTTLLAVMAALATFARMLSLLLFMMPIMLIGYALITIPFDRMRFNHPLQVVRLFFSNLFNRRYELLAIAAVFAVAILITIGLESIVDDSRRTIFKFALITLPLLSTAMLTFASRFESGIAWVGFRLVSEEIRRKIYELRVKRGLVPLTSNDMEELRTHVLNQRTKLDEMGIITPLWGERYEPHADLVRPLWVDDPGDDGYAPLALDQYVNWRLVHQANYYRRRIKSDYSKTRIYRGWILFIGALGAFLAAADYGEFVAVTVAGVTALQAWLSLREHEQSYNIHVRTLLQLEDRIASYYINLKKISEKQTRTELENDTILSFMKSVEDILDEEREMWKNSVLQGQEATESSLAQLVSSTATDFTTDEEAEEGTGSGSVYAPIRAEGPDAAANGHSAEEQDDDPEAELAAEEGDGEFAG